MAAPDAAPRARLSTVQRVRDRLGPEAAGVPDDLLEALIVEQQGIVEGAARRAFKPGADGYDLACTATTNLASAMALIHLRTALAEGGEYRLGKLQVSKRTQLRVWSTLIEQLRLTANEALTILARDARARRFTLVGVDPSS